MNHFTRIILYLSLAVTASALISYSTWRYVFKPAQSREDAFVAYKDGALPVANGVATLPPRLASASVDGKVYVTRETSHTAWLLFLKSRGVGRQFTGYLFCTQQGRTGVKGMVDLDYPNAASHVTARVTRAQNPWSFEVVCDRP